MRGGRSGAGAGAAASIEQCAELAGPSSRDAAPGGLDSAARRPGCNRACKRNVALPVAADVGEVPVAGERRVAERISPQNRHRPRCSEVFSSQNLQQRRFTRAVRAKQQAASARTELNVHVAQKQLVCKRAPICEGNTELKPSL